MKILNPHPALQATSKSLEILLPAAVDLLFHSINETEGRLEPMDKNMEWDNGMENGKD